MHALPQRFAGFGGFIVVFSLSFWTAACSGGSNTQGTGGAGTSTGGAAGGASEGGNSGSTGGSGSGGVTGSGGAGTGGTTGSGGAATGGATGTGGNNSAGGATGAGGTGTFTLTSPGWMNMTGCAADMAPSCGTLPKELTRTGGGVGSSPELNWTGVPAGTKSFAVVLQDLSGNSTHWVLWNISATTTVDGFTFFARTTLAANVDKSTATPAVPAGSQQCSKDPASGAEGYYGPGDCGNVYEFTLYALSVVPFSPTMATDEKQVRAQLLALGTSILGTATLRGRTFAPNCP